MADETYNIIVADQINSAIITKLDAIENSATQADAAVAQLRQDLARLDATSLNILASASQNAVNAVTAQTRAQAQLVNANARLTASTNAQAQAQAKANAINQQAALSQARVGLVGQQTATALQQTTRATAQAALAQARLQNAITSGGRAAGAAAAGFHSTGTAIRELITIPREIIEGRGLGRVAGSISVLAQSQGLLTAATLPFIAAFVGVAAVVGGAAFALASYDAQMQKLQLSVMGVGAQSGITANQLKNLADSTAPSAHMSAGSNESLLSGYLRLGVVVPDVLSRISLATQEYAELSGVKLPEAQKALATALNDPANSFSELERVLGPLSQTTKDHITAIQNQSGAMAAQPALLNAIIDKLKGVDGQLSGEKKTLDQWGEWWSATIRGIQNGLNNLRAPSPDDIVGTNLTRGQRDAQQEAARQVAAQRQATQDAHNKLVSSTVDIDRSTTEGSKRYQVQTLTQQQAQFRLVLNDKLSTPAELHQAAQGLKDVGDQITKLNKQPNAPRTAALKTENIYESSMQKYKDQASLNQLVGPDFQIQQQLNSVVERANNVTDPKTGRRAGGLSSSQLTTLRAVIAADIEQKNVQQQMNAVYAESVKPLEDYQNRLTAIARLQKDGTIDSTDAAAATFAANIKERQRTQFGYSQDDDPEAQAAGLRSQATLQGELTTQRQVDLQVNNAIKAAQAQSLTYTQEQIEALRTRLTFEQAITKETAARDALEKTSVAQQQQDLLTERQALLDLYLRPNHGGLSQSQFTDTDRSQQLSQIDIDTEAKGGTASSLYSSSNAATQEKLNDEVRTYVELRKQGLITAQEEAKALQNIAIAQANANLKAGQGTGHDILTSAFGQATAGYDNPATSAANTIGQALTTLNDQGSRTFANILNKTESAKQGIADLAKEISGNATASLAKMGLQAGEQAIGNAIGLSDPTGITASLGLGGKLGTQGNPMWVKSADGAGGGLGGLGSLFGMGPSGGGSGGSGGGLGGFLSSLFGGGGGAGAGSDLGASDLADASTMFAADGGHVTGAGTSRSDSIHAMVSNGEFIVNAAATARNLPALHAINKGSVSHFANGGYVGANTPYVQSTPVGGTSHTSHTWDFSGASFGNGYSKEQATKDFNNAYDARETKTLGKARVQAVTDTQRYATRQRVKG